MSANALADQHFAAALSKFNATSRVLIFLSMSAVVHAPHLLEFYPKEFQWGAFIGRELFQDLGFLRRAYHAQALTLLESVMRLSAGALKTGSFCPLIMQVAHTGGVHKPQSRDVEGASYRPRDNRR
jgi:hypothetical protein